MKKGGSLSANEAPLSRTALLDCSNHLSALLLSPELPFETSGLWLEGESVLDETPGSLDEALFFCGELWRRETDLCAGGRRGWTGPG